MWLIAHISFPRKYFLKCQHTVMIPFINIFDAQILIKRLTRTCRSGFGDAAPLQMEALQPVFQQNMPHNTHGVINLSTVFFKEVVEQVFYKQNWSLASVSEDQLNW